MERPPAPPEAVLIRLAREAAGIRVAEAAKNAGVSVARWSQIESGSEMRNGRVSPVTGRAGTIARMASEVGVTAGRMETEGQRPDAAEIMREIERQHARGSDLAAEVIPFPVDPDDPVRKALAVQRILGVTIDPDDLGAQEMLRQPLPAEQIAVMIRMLFKVRAEHSSGESGTGRQRR